LELGVNPLLTIIFSIVATIPSLTNIDVVEALGRKKRKMRNHIKVK
jgi:hypothetical protein